MVQRGDPVHAAIVKFNFIEAMMLKSSLTATLHNLNNLKNCVVTWSFSLLNITGYYHDVVFNKALIDSATVFTYLIGSFHNFTFSSHRLNLIWRRVPVHAARDDFRIN